jgi:hypothetical protein
LGLVSCGGGGDGPIGSQDQSIVPCNRGLPSFDVWRADFAPNGRQFITATVDTRNSSTATEFRLVLACQGEVVAEAIDGIACSNPPPQISDGPAPVCPLIQVDVTDIDFSGRIECLAEITSTQPLDIGTGGCADPQVADYRIVMKIDTASLDLALVADDCRDEESCLESMFGID